MGKIARIELIEFFKAHRDLSAKHLIFSAAKRAGGSAVFIQENIPGLYALLPQRLFCFQADPGQVDKSVTQHNLDFTCAVQRFAVIAKTGL